MIGDSTLYASPIVANREMRGSTSPKSACPTKRGQLRSLRAGRAPHLGHHECHLIRLPRRAPEEPLFGKIEQDGPDLQ